MLAVKRFGGKFHQCRTVPLDHLRYASAFGVHDATSMTAARRWVKVRQAATWLQQTPAQARNGIAVGIWPGWA